MSFSKDKESVWGFLRYFPRCDLSCRTPFIQQQTKLLCCEAHLLIHELYPHCETTSRRWAAFSISIVGCLQVLYLGMFGQYSLAFGPLCSHTINNKPFSRGDMCTFVVILLKQVHTHWALFGQQHFFLTCYWLTHSAPSFFFFLFPF